MHEESLVGGCDVDVDVFFDKLFLSFDRFGSQDFVGADGFD